MLKSQCKLDAQERLWYICNNCHNLYNLEEASIHHKGNQYFCSMKCVLEYEKQYDREAVNV